MVSDKNLLSYLDCIIPFNINTDAYGKQLGASIIHNNKPIELLSSRLSKSQRDYTTNKKTSCNSGMSKEILRNYICILNKGIFRS